MLSLKIIVFKCFHKVAQLEFKKAFYGFVPCFISEEQKGIHGMYGCVRKSREIWVCRSKSCVEVCEANPECPWELK